jgi:ADP-dependent NAD(P)H-hydrate dehydratase / NAD(P)H-hydrate epimerase
MDLLPVEVYTAASVRAMDRSAIEQAGIPGYTLMQRAGEAAFNALRRHWPTTRIVAVLCGPGNNGGDGYVVARLARAAGLDVRAIAPAGARGLRGDAARAQADFTAAGGRVLALDADALDGCDLAVDALLGTGIDRPLDDPYSVAIRQVNRLQVPVLALDIPSGLHADTGEPQGLAVRASRTLAFVALKSGYFLGQAPDHVGTLEFAGLDVPKDIRDAHDPVMRRIDAGVTTSALQPRLRSAHKGDHGRVVIVGGHAMPGAARLAGEAALRTGAGLVTVATSAEGAAAILAGRPELIVGTASSRPEFENLCRFSSIAIGPGLGMQDGTGTAIEAALEVAGELVLDADALNFLAGNPRKSDRWILTPHPGEAARMLGAQPAEIQRDRLGALRMIVERYGGTCVLKGANTLVQGPTHTPWVCDRGNPGMATAGSGDVLTGMIAALLAATHDRELAATAGVFLHAEAGDRAARHGMRGMIASDIVAELRGVVNQPWR